MNQVEKDIYNLNLQKNVILLIDDNPANLNVLNDFLTGYNFEVLVARTGETGLKRAEYVLPDIVLLDIMMPDINGFEVCKNLKKNKYTKNIPVILITALSEIEFKIKGFEAGAVDYITKPFQKDEVLARISTHLRLQKLTELLNEKAHKAGMAEIASGILHNVGNLLNNIMVSTQVIRDIVNKESYEDYSRVCDILRENIDSLEKFVLNNPKAKKIMEFFLAFEDKIIDERGNIF